MDIKRRNETVVELFKCGFTCWEIIEAMGKDSFSVSPRNDVRGALILKDLYEKGYKFT